MSKQSQNKEFTTTAAKAAAVKKINPSVLGELNFANDHDVGDYAMIMIGGPGIHPESITIHHPIGVTRLNQGSWVGTRTTDFHFLLSRSKDPDLSIKQRARDSAALEFLINNNLLLGTKENPRYPQDKVSGDTDRNKRLAEVNRLLKADNASALEKHKAEQEGKPKAKKFAYGRIQQDFMPEDMKTYEKHLRLQVKEGVQNEEGDDPYRFETRGGPGDNEFQKPVDFLDRSKKPSEVSTTLLTKVLSMLNGVTLMGAPPVTAPGGVVVPPDPGTDSLQKKIVALEEELRVSKTQIDAVKRWYAEAGVRAVAHTPKDLNPVNWIKVIMTGYPLTGDAKSSSPGAT